TATISLVDRDVKRPLVIAEGGRGVELDGNHLDIVCHRDRRGPGAPAACADPGQTTLQSSTCVPGDDEAEVDVAGAIRGDRGRDLNEGVESCRCCCVGAQAIERQLADLRLRDGIWIVYVIDGTSGAR